MEVQDQGASKVEFWRRPSSGWQTADFSLYPHMMEEARDLSGTSFIRALVPFMRAPPS